MKTYKVTCPAIRLRKTRTAKTHLAVKFSPRLNLVWKEIRPMIACAFRRGWTPTLYLAKSSRGGWWGRACGAKARVYVGSLHEEPRQTTYPKFKDMPVFWHMDWREHLVGLVAHELWHRWQPGSGKAAEYMCELVEWDAIEAWRREQGYQFKPQSVHLEPDDFRHDSAENCADCRQPTRYWLEDQHTPLCLDCCQKRALKLAENAKKSVREVKTQSLLGIEESKHHELDHDPQRQGHDPRHHRPPERVFRRRR